MSSGYLSELERGRKEVSSELLAAICTALDTSVAELLMEVVANMSLHSIQEELATTSLLHVAHDHAQNKDQSRCVLCVHGTLD